MYCIKFILISACLTFTNAFLSDYLSGIRDIFGYSNEKIEDNSVDNFNNKVLYEVSTLDEKFISEAAKLTGVAFSELDKCQQRIVLRLNKECNKMNDEDISKMAVMLLNCQSSIEGRRTYPCVHEMSIKDCTKDMDPDTWNTYHLMANRVRAVCYTSKQSQFIGLTEHTINRLVSTTNSQVKTLDKLVSDQKSLQDLAEDTLQSVHEGHTTLVSQQKDLEKAQLHGQLLIENNLRRLADEKSLITETHRELSHMAKNLQEKIDDAAGQLKEQSQESSLNHKEILEDLLRIQRTTQDIFERIEYSSKLLLEQSERAHLQYMGTLKQLSEVNDTVHSLANLMYGTRQALEDRLTWISSALGGTDVAVDRLYLLTWHIAFIIVSMIGSAFIDLSSSGRILAISLPSLNLAVGLNDTNLALNVLQLTIAWISLIILHGISRILFRMYKLDGNPNRLSLKAEESPIKKTNGSYNTSEFISPEENSDKYLREDSSQHSNETNSRFDYTNSEDTFNEFYSPTPPLSRLGDYSSRSRSRTPLNVSITKNHCSAKTRLGTPCKITSLPGRDYCHRHLRGDSVMG